MSPWRFRRLKRVPLPPTVVLGPIWRRRPVLCAAIALLLVLTALGRGGVSGSDDHDRYHNRVFTVASAVDGDTLDINHPDGTNARTRVRLWGVDTPEVAGSRDGDQHFGAEASAFAQAMLLDKQVRLLLAPHRARDKYDRLLAYVIIEASQESFNELLLEEGYAYADWRFSHPLKVQYGQLERAARRDGIGLWQQATADRMPRWRRRTVTERGDPPRSRD